MRFFLRLLFFAALALSSNAADAAMGGVRRPLLAGGATCPSNVGMSLRGMAAIINANPSTNLALSGDCSDRTPFTYSPVASTYNGTFNLNGHTVSYTLINNDNCNTLPSACSGTVLGFGLFQSVGASGRVTNGNVYGRVFQNGSMLDGTLQTWRVGIIAGYNAGEIDHMGCSGILSGAGYYDYNACIAAQNTGSVLSNTCNAQMSLTLQGQNAMLACGVAFNEGIVTTLHVTGGSYFIPSGFSQGHTQQCATPPCKAVGGYIAAGVAAVGYSTIHATATFITVDAGIPVTNAIDTVANLGVTGGAIGVVFYGNAEDNISQATVSGTGSVSCVIGRVQNPPTGATPGIALRNICGALGQTIASVGPAGGVVGVNAGLTSFFENFGNVISPLAVNVAGGIGQNYNGGAWDHGFNWGIVSCKGVCAGLVGFGNATSTTGDQGYNLAPILGGATVASIYGVCNNNAGITNTYSNSTTTNLSVLCGSVTSPTGMASLTTTQFLSGMPTGFDASWIQDTNAGGYPYLAGMPIPAAPPVYKPRKRITLTTASSSPIDLSVAAPDFNCSTNIIVARGPGGNGGASTTTTGSGGGGGGGAYAYKIDYCPSGPVNFTVGGGGSGTATVWDNASLLKAAAGSSGAPGTAGAGGPSNQSVGDFIRGGGNGASAGSGGRSGGGGGGAGGPNGGGATGGSGFGNSTVGAGGGGGGANGGTAGAPGTVSSGGNGGNSFDPTPPITAAFTASMTLNVLSISAISSGTIVPNQVVTGASVPANTVILTPVQGSATDWIVSTSVGSPISSESMTGATPSGATAGGAGSASTSTPGGNGLNSSGAGAGFASTLAASVGGAGSGDCTQDQSGSGGGGGAGLRVLLVTGAAGGAGGCNGGGGGGAGAGITNPTAASAGGDGTINVEWQPL